MKPIPLVSETYQTSSVPGAAHRLINMFPERLPEGGRAPFMLRPTAGIAAFATLATGPVHASAAVGGAIWVVAGDTAYWMQDNPIPAPASLGTVGTCDTAHRVTIAIGLTGVVIVVPPNAYVTDFAGAALQQIVTGGGNFPAEGVASVAFIDGYYVFVNYYGTYFFTSAILDATTYSGLTYVRLSSEVDFLEHCVYHNRELWLFCQNTVQVWYDTGDANAPFQSRSGGVIPHGVGAPRTVCDLDGSLFWVGIDGVVWRTSGYQAKRVSTHPLEALLQTFNSGYLRTAQACSFLHDGHGYYALTLPEADRTFVYDVTTGVWHERSSTTSGNGRWRVNTATLLGARWLLGDSTTGALHHMATATATEAGTAVRRVAQLPAIVTHGPRAFMPRLEVEMGVGVSGGPSTVDLSWSDDGGINFTTPRSITMPTVGSTRGRVVSTRLGSFRQRVLQLSAGAPMTVYAIDADITAGEV